MIDRRTFFACLAVPRFTVLEAVAAPSLPHTRVIPRLGDAGSIVEFRTYLDSPPLPLFEKAGIFPIRKSGNTYVIPFPSLADRARAWDALAADPAFRELPNEPRLTHLSIYRRLS